LWEVHYDPELMIDSHSRRRSGPGRFGRNGFSLVITLMLMMLLAIIALGLLQLSTISLRSAGQEKDRAEARANARVALMLALGQLQKEMGPDRRITAPAALLDSNPATLAVDGVENPHFTGVWDAAEEVTAANMDATPGAKNQGFRSWLVSGEDEIRHFDFAAKTSLLKDGHARRAVGAGAVADPVDQVSVPVIDGTRSGFAWWIADNGQKATVRGRAASVEKTQDLASVLASCRRFNPLGFHAMDAALPDNEADLRKLPDLQTVDVKKPGDDRPSRRYFHDLTSHSEVIPVDVTTGRLKSCLNLQMAWMQQQGGAGAGTLGPNAGVDRDFRMFSWDQLRHALSYSQDRSKVTFSSGGRPQVTTFKQTGYGGGKDDAELNPSISRDRWRIQPVLLKTIHIISYGTERTSNPPDPSKPERTHALRLYDYPVTVLWNPYNVDLVVPEYCAGSSPIPVVFNVTNGAEVNRVDWVQHRVGIYTSFGPECPQQKLTDLVIPAGATRVLYPQAFDPANPSYHRNKFPYDFYLWLKQKNFDCGPGNYGAPFLNLKNTAADISFVSSPGNEIAGAPGDSLKISITPSTTDAVGGAWPLTFQWAGEHTDWHGNNGTGTDDLNTILRFGVSTNAGFRFKANSPQISVIPEKDVPVRTFAELEGKPTPLMIFETYRKPVDEDLFPNKNWAFSLPTNPISTGPTAAATDAVTPWHEGAYTFRFKAVNSWVEVAQRMQLPPTRDDECYMGTSYSPAGQTRAIAQEIPLVAPVSLAQLQHLPLFDYRPEGPIENPFSMNIDYKFHRGRATQFAQNNAIGNSYASPGIAPTAITNKGWPTYGFDVSNQSPIRMDRSYVANKLLWDAWWCSSLAPQNGSFFNQYGSPRGLDEVARQFVKDGGMLPDEACQLRAAQSPDDVLASLFGKGGELRDDTYKRLAAFVRINGGFNVNSASPKAWRHLFSQMLSRPMVEMDSVSGQEKPTIIEGAENTFLISRFSFQGGQPAERAQGRNREDGWWNGSRELSAAELSKLAEATVREVKLRGPFRSLADFVNRRLSSDTSLSLKGPLQAALDDPSTRINEPLAEAVKSAPQTSGTPTYAFPEAAAGAARQGIPGWVTQADLLQVIGPALSPRSDTFTIRAMGESRDPDGKVKATAWCEAVIQRGADYVSSDDSAITPEKELKNSVNKLFGRRMEIVSFRWLAASEVR